MMDQEQAYAQYIFLDVVRFTQGRSIEAQVEIVQALNGVVSEVLEGETLAEPERILLPTGDGIAIAILRREQFDLSLRMACAIITKLTRRNEVTLEKSRRFSIRIGVNHNIDNVIIDINGNRNIAGRGINMAQRVMSLADEDQILVGEPVYDILCEREAYAGSFRRLLGRDKHGNAFHVYQLIGQGVEGLNREIPILLRTSEATALQMNAYIAHFVANAERYREFWLEHKTSPGFEYTALILLHLLTRDSMDNTQRNPLREPSRRVDVARDGFPLSAYRAIDNSDFAMRMEFAAEIKQMLWSGRGWFETDETSHTVFWTFPTEAARRQVQEKFPETWDAVVSRKLGEVI